MNSVGEVIQVRKKEVQCLCIQRSTDKIGVIAAALNESLNTVADIPMDAHNIAAGEDIAMTEVGGQCVTKADERKCDKRR